jgi:hypothetical protein
MLFTLLAAGAMLAAVPAASVALGGHDHRGGGDRHREREHRREHRPGHHRARIRHERFGSRAAHQTLGHAGTVASFAGGRLTIRLNDGSRVTGAVNRATEIECEMRGDRNDRGDRNHRGDDGPRHDIGDDHGHGGPGGGGPGGGGPGDGGPGHHDGDRDRHRCATIAPGTTVRDATLAVTGLGAVWTRVDLIDS